MKNKFCCKVYEDKYKDILENILVIKDINNKLKYKLNAELLSARSEVIFKNDSGEVDFKYIILNERNTGGFDFYCTKSKENYYLSLCDFIDDISKKGYNSYNVIFNILPRRKDYPDELLFTERYGKLAIENISTDNETLDLRISKRSLKYICDFINENIESACKQHSDESMKLIQKYEKELLNLR